MAYELRESDVIITINQDQDIILCGDNSLSLVGWTSKEMMNKKITDFMDERKARVHHIHTETFIKEGAQRKNIGKFMVPKKDESMVEVYIYITSREAVFRNGEHLITGAMWNAKIVDNFNAMKKQNAQMFDDIKKTSGIVTGKLKDITERVEGLQDILLQMALNNKSLDEDQKSNIIQIINEGGKGGSSENDINLNQEQNVKE